MTQPSPPHLPLNVSSQEFVRDKVAAYHWMLQEAPVCPMRFSMLHGYFVCRYEDCNLVLRDARQQGSDWWMRLLPRSLALTFDSMINKDDPDHKRLRGFINAAFTPRSVKVLAPSIEARTDGLLDAMERLLKRFSSLEIAVPFEALEHVPTFPLNAYKAVPITIS